MQNQWKSLKKTLKFIENQRKSMNVIANQLKNIGNHVKSAEIIQNHCKNIENRWQSMKIIANKVRTTPKINKNTAIEKPDVLYETLYFLLFCVSYKLHVLAFNFMIFKLAENPGGEPIHHRLKKHRFRHVAIYIYTYIYIIHIYTRVVCHTDS